MALSRDVPLLTTAAQVAQITAVIGVGASLPTSGEFTVAGWLLAAHQQVFDMVRARGVDFSRVTNDTELKAAVAWQAVLVLAGSVIEKPTPEFARERLEDALRAFRPIYDSGNTPRNASETGIPAVANWDDGSVAGPGLSISPLEQSWGGVIFSRGT